ncbi:MAG: glutathione peroxidase [Myxococcales bacterium]|nr:glutathione peroxidase [Myxococcales bacterium]
MIEVGNKIPNVTLKYLADDGLKEIATGDVLGKGKVVLFSVPGAYTPTCSTQHLPGFVARAEEIRSKGVSDIVCLAVNDPFVMRAWGKEHGADGKVTMLPDGNGEFTEKIGMLVDKSDLGFGKRSWRYSMLVEDGVIQKMFIEPDKPGDPFEVSDADTMLKHINPKAKQPAEVTIFAKPGCPFCLGAKELLKEKGYDYEEILLSGPISYKSLRNVTGKSTAPQIYIDGRHIDGLDGLKEFFQKNQ